jgi:hypothetical protein
LTKRPLHVENRLAGDGVPAGAGDVTPAMVGAGVRLYREWASEYGLAGGDAWEPSDATVAQLVVAVMALTSETPRQ